MCAVHLLGGISSDLQEHPALQTFLAATARRHRLKMDLIHPTDRTQREVLGFPGTQWPGSL